MGLSTIFKGLLRDSSSTEITAAMSQQGEQYVRTHVPDMASLVNAGKVWKAQDLTTTAVAVTMPTTTAGLTMQNPASSGKTYLVLAVTAYSDVSAAGLHGVGLCHSVHQAGVALYTRDIALTSVKGMKAGQGAYGGEVILDRGATVADDLFSPIGGTYNSAIASQVWSQLYVALQVPVVVPAGQHYSVGATAHSATVEVGLGLVWAELSADELA